MNLLEAGVLITSLGLTYGLWAIVRVLRLRQNVYAKRDWLFMEAARLHQFDDPGYRAARDNLNALTGVAKFISLPLLLHMAGTEEESDQPPKCNTLEMQELVDEVYDWVARRVMSYVFHETATGWLFRVSTLIVLSSGMQSLGNSGSKRILNAKILGPWKSSLRIA